MSSHRFERIGLGHFTAAVPALRHLGEPDLAEDLDNAARDFCQELGRHRRSPAYRVRLRDPSLLGLAHLAWQLLASADVLRQGDDDQAALGAWCSALAARLHALEAVPDPRDSLVVVFIDIDRRGKGELVFVPLQPGDLHPLPGLGDEESL